MRRETAAPVVIGVDIRRSALATAREAAIGSTLIETDCLPIPFRDGSFDVIFQFTTFSSIPETDAKVRIAREILRVLATGGVFLWYDMRYPNPGNRFTRCETRATIGHYFPGTDFHLESMTLIPQIGRWIYPSRPRLGGLLGRLAGLHSHYFGWFLKG
jgi:SAM-dependent methyltransferase